MNQEALKILKYLQPYYLGHDRRQRIDNLLRSFKKSDNEIRELLMGLNRSRYVNIDSNKDWKLLGIVSSTIKSVDVVSLSDTHASRKGDAIVMETAILGEITEQGIKYLDDAEEAKRKKFKHKWGIIFDILNFIIAVSAVIISVIALYKSK